MQFEKFFNSESLASKSLMRSRIANAVSSDSWKTTIAIILENDLAFGQLKVIEVGCGTGTLSLILNLLGANTTLLDADEDALNLARALFDMYGREATFIKANVLEDVPNKKLNSFDLAISAGLAEHFMNDDREKCIAFHELLLKKNGFAVIGVPNRFGVFYRLVRGFRELTKTWTISQEIPFTYWELKRYAKKVGFVRSEIVGNASLRKDMRVYFMGLISAVLDAFPQEIRKALKKIKKNENKKNECDINVTDEVRMIVESIDSIRKKKPLLRRKAIKNKPV